MLKLKHAKIKEKQPKLNLESLLQQTSVSTYTEFKRRRTQLAYSCELVLMKSTEEQINAIFTYWESLIKDCSFDEANQQLFDNFTIISLLFYYQRDFIILKNYENYISLGQASKDRIVVRCSSKVVAWMSVESGGVIYSMLQKAKEFMKLVMENKNVELFFPVINSMYSLKRILHFDSIIDVITTYYDNFLEMFLVSDDQVQRISTKLLKAYLNRSPFATSHKDLESAFSLAMENLYVDDLNKINGSVLILKALLCFHSRTDNNIMDSIITRCIQLIDSYSYPISKSISEFTITNFKCINRFCSNDVMTAFFDKLCINIKKSPCLFPVLKLFVQKSKGNINSFLKLFQDEDFPNKNNDEAAYDVLNTILELYPEISIDKTFYPKGINIAFLPVIKTRNNIYEDRKELLREYFNNIISKDSNESDIITALKICRAYPKMFFTGLEDMVNIVKPHMKHPSEEIRKLIISIIAQYSTHEANLQILNYALFDSSKYVRHFALESLIINPELSYESCVFQTLHDSSYKNRRLSIRIVAKLMDFNPLEIIPLITEYLQLVVNNLIVINEPIIKCKMASLMEPLCGIKTHAIQDNIESLISILHTILTNEEFQNEKYMLRDTPATKYTFVPDVKSEPKRSKIYQIRTERFRKKRDIALLNSINAFGSDRFLHRALFISTCLDMFTKKSDDILYLYLKAINDNHNENLSYFAYVRDPQISSAVLDRLNSSQSIKLTNQIIKFIGQVFNGVDFFDAKSFFADTSTMGIKIKEPHYVVTIIFDYLLENLDNLVMYKDATMLTFALLFQYHPIQSIKYMPHILPFFFSILDKSSSKQAEQIFQYLEVILSPFPAEIQPISEQLQRILIKNFNLTNCVRLCAALAYHHKTTFIPISLSLYNHALFNLDNKDIVYFEYLTKFISFCVILQFLPFELFMCRVQSIHKCMPFEGEFITYLFQAITQCYLNANLKLFESRILSFCAVYLKTKNPYVSKLFLMIKHNAQIEESLNWNPSCESGIPIEGECELPELGFPITHLPHLDNEPKTDLSFLLNLTYPEEDQMFDWYMKLYYKLIHASDEPEIRVCTFLEAHDLKFNSMMIPYALLSCWKIANKEQRANFNRVFVDIIKSHKFFTKNERRIIILLYRFGDPIDIDIEVLVNTMCTPALILYILEKRFLDNSLNSNTINLLFKSNFELGHMITLNGLYKHCFNMLDIQAKASWALAMENYSDAMKMYDNMKEASFEKSICKIFRKDFKGIIDEEDMILKANQNSSDATMCVAWAYFILGNKEKIIEYNAKFEQEWTADKLMLASMSSLKYNPDRTQQYLNDGFLWLAKNKDEFLNGTQRRQVRVLQQARHLVETEEIIKVRAGILSKEDVAKAWNNRVNGFDRTTNIWCRLISLQRQLFPIETELRFYLKTISQLRKERRFDIIYSFFFDTMSSLPGVDLTIACIKIFWAQGLKEKAIFYAKLAVNFIKSKNISEFRTSFLNVPSKKKLYLMRGMLKCNGMDAVREAVCADLGIKDVNSYPQYMINNKDEEFYNDYNRKLIDNYPKEIFNSFLQQKVEFMNSEIREFARLHRFHGHYLCRISHTRETLEKAVKYFKEAASLVQDDYRIWQELGYTYARLALNSMNDQENYFYASESVKAFMKATLLNPEGTIAYCIQINCFRINFAHGNIPMPLEILQQAEKLHDERALFAVIGQILENVNSNPFPDIRNFYKDTVLRLGEINYQLIIFPLYFWSSMENGQNTKDVFDILRSKYPQISYEADLLCYGLIHSLHTWLENWLDAINDSISSKDPNKILQEQFENSLKPETELDTQYLAHFHKDVEELYVLFKQQKQREFQIALRLFYQKLTQMNDSLNQIFLRKVSVELASKRDMSLVIPGKWLEGPDAPTIQLIDGVLDIVHTEQKPRFVRMKANTGETYKFMLIDNDLRTEKRLMHVFGLFNSYFSRDYHIAKANAHISIYDVVCISLNTGFISWIPGAQGLSHIIVQHREANNISQTKESKILSELSDVDFNKFNSLQRIEAFEEVSKECKADELFNYFWIHAPSPATWLNRRFNYTATYAVMCMVGFLMGLGNRHPGNILLQPDTGKIIHINYDYEDMFENRMSREVFPENVPFRLTRMIINAFEGCIVDGIFKEICEDVLNVLRSYGSSVTGNLHVLMKEPIDAEQKNQIIDKMEMKLNGTNIETGQLDSVQDQVQWLINVSSDPTNYIRHYSGWCPFW